MPVAPLSKTEAPLLLSLLTGLFMRGTFKTYNVLSHCYGPITRYHAFPVILIYSNHLPLHLREAHASAFRR